MRAGGAPAASALGCQGVAVRLLEGLTPHPVGWDLRVSADRRGEVGQFRASQPPRPRGYISTSFTLAYVASPRASLRRSRRCVEKCLSTHKRTASSSRMETRTGTARTTGALPMRNAARMRHGERRVQLRHFSCAAEAAVQQLVRRRHRLSWMRALRAVWMALRQCRRSFVLEAVVTCRVGVPSAHSNATQLQPPSPKARLPLTLAVSARDEAPL